jgi:hypothetical protein
MHTGGVVRGHRTDLLARPPSGVFDPAAGWAALIVDPVAQLEELADLVERDLLSSAEFERLKARVVGVGVATRMPDGGLSPLPPDET